MAFPDPIQVINPQTGNPFTSRANNASLIKAAAEQGLAQYQDIAMKRIVALMAQESTESVANALTIFGESLRDKFSAAREYELRNIHLKAAQSAQQAMLQRYAKIVAPRSLGGYRADAPGKWKRYSGGQLEKALASPNFYRASKDGILWGLKGPLDQAAPQWYRVNYGAGPRGQGYRAAQSFPVDPSGLNLIPKSFVASGQYILPKGVFGEIGLIERGVNTEQRLPRVDITRIRGGMRGPGARKRRGSPLEFGPAAFENGKPVYFGDKKNLTVATQPFHPIGYVLSRVPEYGGPTVSRRHSRGFAGAFFIEAGLRRMGRVLPASYKGLMRKWLREAAASAPSGPISKIIDTPTANSYLRSVEVNIQSIANQQINRFLNQ